MRFHSFDFLALFLIIFVLYWALRHRRAQNALLLVASAIFYGWVHPWFLILLTTSTVVDYAVSNLMERWPARKRPLLLTSILANLGLLGAFKYWDFFIVNVAAALSAIGFDPHLPLLRVVLPVGISFYTFQTLSYTIDVFRGQLRARKDLLEFALFVAFMPQLVAGPIERAGHLLPQIEHPRSLRADLLRSAVVLMCWGFFKKLVIADNVGIIANKVFALREPGFEVLWAGVFAFGIQIYADFSAYTDIARGVARSFGFELMQNFRQPYFARGPIDLWRRWHISLSTWFRDYVYVPLGGSRGPWWSQVRALLLTFLLSGLWHGASWNFVLWGAYHGVLVGVAHVTRPLRRGSREVPAVMNGLRVLGMFVLTMVGWLFFREGDITQIGRALSLSPLSSTPDQHAAGVYLALLTGIYALPIAIEHLVLEFRTPFASGEAPSVAAPIVWWRPALRLAGQATLAGVLFTGIVVMRSRTALDFIYFQF